MSSPSPTATYVRAFRKDLLSWFDQHARDLPWRRTDDAYAIWVSEIMLQQTRVAAVLEHYALFLKRFPTLRALAGAAEAAVLTVWSGLGYYRRAKLLHKAAQYVIEELDGTMPRTEAELRALPGVGSYTAAAIASIAFGEAAAAVDGNVERVVMRLMGLGEEKIAGAEPLGANIRRIANALLDPARPGDFNQAMMELGATICLPRSPLCLQCPVRPLCRTQGEHATLPRKKMQRRQVAYALVERGGSANGREIYMERRPHDASLMPGMWELPQLELARLTENEAVLTLRHSITNTNYDVSIAQLTAQEAQALPHGNEHREWLRVEDLLTIPLTGLSRKALKALRMLPATPASRAKNAMPDTVLIDSV